jgi:hypothetical protein
MPYAPEICSDQLRELLEFPLSVCIFETILSRIAYPHQEAPQEWNCGGLRKKPSQGRWSACKMEESRMIDFARIRAVKRDAQTRLLKIPGVHAVAFGPKVVAGKSTQDPAIIVYLVKKKSAGEVPPEELIPSEIDGVKTDVIEQSIPTAGATLEGGMKITRPGASWGTLGFIATSADKEKVYATTCYHVVQPVKHKRLQLEVDATSGVNSVSYAFSGSVSAQSLIYVNFEPNPLTQHLPAYGAYYTTTGTETLDEVAANVAQAIEDMAVTGIDTSVPGGGQLDVNVPAGYKSTCVITGKTISPRSDLHAKIDGHTITFSGKVSSDVYGVFTNVTPGGAEPTYGAFAGLNKDDSMEDVANAVATAVDDMHITGVDVTSSNGTVTIESPMVIDVIISPDVRIGHERVCSNCWFCCGPSIGTIDQARLDVDTALVELNPGLDYFADQVNFGPVKDIYFIQDSDIHPGPYLVKKYGAKTGKTHGHVTSLDRVGFRSDDEAPFHRQYSGVITVSFDENNADNSPDALYFSDHGDSGSAVINDNNQVVGTVFAHIDDGTGLVTPLKSIIDAFNITVVTAQTAGQTQTVPPYAMSRVARSRAPITGGMPISRSILETRDEILSTPTGQEYADAITQHAAEVQQLINTNRRVATVWQRSGGPQIIQAALDMLQNRNLPFPAEIEGKALAECVENIEEILLRYSSPDLAAGLRKYAPRIVELAGLNYVQSLAWLKTPRAS